MSRTRARLQAIQNALFTHGGGDNTCDLIDTFLLPDRTRVNIVQFQLDTRRTRILVDDVPVCTYQSPGRTEALLLSAVGTSHEHTATHVPRYRVLEIHPQSTRQITVQDAWAIIHALFVRYHEQETIPIVLSPDIDNRADLCAYILGSGLGRTGLSKQTEADDLFLSRAAFWQGAGIHGYHARGWLPPLSSLTRHAASPFPSVQSFTRTPLVITAHPLRPPKPLPGELLYRRYCPTVGETLEFTYFDVGEEDQITPHLEALHKWHNDDRVNSGWNERGSLEQHRQYVHDVLNNPGVLPMVMSWDGELMGYLEIVYIKVRWYPVQSKWVFAPIYQRRRITLQLIFRVVRRSGTEAYMYLLGRSGSEAWKEVGVATWTSSGNRVLTLPGSTGLAPLNPSLHLSGRYEDRKCNRRAEG